MPPLVTDFNPFASEDIQRILDLQRQFNEQAVRDRQQAAFIGQQGAFGGAQFVRDAAGNLTRQEFLDPAQQSQVDARNQLIQGLLGQIGAQGQFDLGALPAAPEAFAGDFGAERADIEQRLFENAQRRLAPGFEQERAQLEQNLANRGIPVGSQLFNEQIRQFEQNRSDALQDALARATATAGGEQERLFGFEQARFGQQAGLRERGLAEALTARGLPFQEVQAILSQQQQVTQPTLLAPGQVPVSDVDVLGAFGTVGGFEQQRELFGQGQQFQRDETRFLAEQQKQLAELAAQTSDRQLQAQIGAQMQALNTQIAANAAQNQANIQAQFEVTQGRDPFPSAGGLGAALTGTAGVPQTGGGRLGALGQRTGQAAGLPQARTTARNVGRIKPIQIS